MVIKKQKGVESIMVEIDTSIEQKKFETELVDLQKQLAQHQGAEQELIKQIVMRQGILSYLSGLLKPEAKSEKVE